MKVKFVKKLVALSLVSAMTLTGLAGCGSKDSGDGKKEGGDGKTLKVAAFNGGNGEQIWKDIAAAFEEENDGVKVELEISSELDKDLTKEIKNGDVPDVVYYNLGQESGFTETMLKEKAVADISDVFEGELGDKMLDGILDSTISQPYGDGKIYLAPIFYTPTGFWYNKNLFEGENAKYTFLLHGRSSSHWVIRQRRMVSHSLHSHSPDTLMQPCTLCWSRQVEWISTIMR